MCQDCPLLFWYTWTGQVKLFGMNEMESIQFVFENGADINKMFNVENETQTLLFVFASPKTRWFVLDRIRWLISHNYDFGKYVNIAIDQFQSCVLLFLSTHSKHLQSLKLFYQHCKQLDNGNLDVLRVDKWYNNAIHYSIHTHFPILEFLLSNVYFPNNDISNQTGKIAINCKDYMSETPAHIAAMNNKTAKHLELLHKYGCDFNISNIGGDLPIHVACRNNAYFCLSLMIQLKVYQDVNITSKTLHKTKTVECTALEIAIESQNVECVDVLCQQPSVEIALKDIEHAILKDNVAIVEILLQTILRRHDVDDWDSIKVLDSSSVVSQMRIAEYADLVDTSTSCHQLFTDLIENGYERQNYYYIAKRLKYNPKSLIKAKNKAIGSVDVNGSIAAVDKYTIQDVLLGEGSFGKVKLATDKTAKKKRVAVKYIKLKTKIQSQFLADEINAVKSITHQNVIRLLDFDMNASNNDLHILVFEYAEFGQLFELLKKVNHFDIDVARRYFEQILSGLAACHAKNIVHRDLKGENILLSSTFQIKIADFGLVSIFDVNEKAENRVYNVGTKFYKSPELVDDATQFDVREFKVLKACDVFSGAILFWEMVNGVKYYPFLLDKSLYQGRYKYIKNKNYQKFWEIHKDCNILVDRYSADLCRLFEQMFEFDPFKRLTIDKIQQHQWFAKCDKSDEAGNMDDFMFEAKIRSLYHSNNKQQQNRKLETVDSNSNTSNSCLGSSSSSDTDSSSNFKVIDSSKVSTSQFNHLSIQAKRNLLHSHTFSMISPLVVVVGVGDYNNKTEKQNANESENEDSNALPDKIGVEYDYKHVIDVFYGMKNWNVMYQTIDNEIKCLSQSKKDHLKISKHDQCKRCWTWEEIIQFNDNVFETIKNESDDNDDCKYDGLIYILSANINNDYGQHMVYDSLSHECPIGEIFNKFNNINCVYLRKKPKIFILDGNDPNSPSNNIPNFNIELSKHAFHKSTQLSQFHQIKLSEKHKFIIFNNMESCSRSWSHTHGGYLINAICATTAIDHVTQSDTSSVVATCLNTIVEQSENRIEQVIGNINISGNSNLMQMSQISTKTKFIVTEDYVPGSIVFGKLEAGQQWGIESKKNDEMNDTNRPNEIELWQSKQIHVDPNDVIYQIFQSTNCDLYQSTAMVKAMHRRDENENKMNNLHQEKDKQETIVETNCSIRINTDVFNHQVKQQQQQAETDSLQTEQLRQVFMDGLHQQPQLPSARGTGVGQVTDFCGRNKNTNNRLTQSELQPHLKQFEQQVQIESKTNDEMNDERNEEIEVSQSKQAMTIINPIHGRYANKNELNILKQDENKQEKIAETDRNTNSNMSNRT